MCVAAFKFYEQCLGGKITDMMTYAESPEPATEEEIPLDWHNKIMHASLMIGDRELMGSDSLPQYHQETTGFSVNITQGLIHQHCTNYLTSGNNTVNRFAIAILKINV